MPGQRGAGRSRGLRAVSLPCILAQERFEQRPTPEDWI